VTEHALPPAQEPSTSATISRILDYSAVRPLSGVDALRLYRCYLEATFAHTFRPKQFRHVGAYLGGFRELSVRVGGVKFRVRPRTEDLGVVTDGHRPFRVGSDWFRPAGGDDFVDIGASIGYYSLRAAKAGARVTSVEPHPDTFRLLSENIRFNGFDRIRAYNCAVGSHAGSAPLYQPKFGTGLASLDPAWEGTSDPRPSVVVPLATLDSLTGDLPKVDWMMIDVEGHETEVLRGGSATLGKTRHLILEVTHGENEGACREILQQHGFRHFEVRPLSDARNDYWFVTR
jgi:FkbM family methyltransferase